VIYSQAFRRFGEGKVVRAGLIGVGDFGAPIVTQSPLVRGLDLCVVADLDVERGQRAYLEAGYGEEQIALCGSRAEALSELEAGRRVVLDDASLMMELPIQVIATGTRVPEAGAVFAEQAILHGKHVVMIDKEADSVVGSLLKLLADRAGLVYTTDDGDEPGLLMGLYSWAQALGLEVLCGGKLESCLHDPRRNTLCARGRESAVSPEDRWALERIPGGQARRYVEGRRHLRAAWQADEDRGDPICHMAIICNGTGLIPDAPTGHRSLVRLVEIPEVFCPEEEEGVLRTRGAVDMPTVLFGPDDPEPGGGVFLVVANADAGSREVMIEKGLVANSRRSAMLLYRPYHLCGAETAMSILCAGLLRVPTGATEVLPRVDILATTARDYRAGEALGSPGALGLDHGVKASLVPAFALTDTGPAPFFLLENRRLTQDTPAGTVITMDRVDLPQDSPLLSLRKRQDALFLRGGSSGRQVVGW
jgi:predicted homoserine dehydrogenase-like protein